MPPTSPSAREPVATPFRIASSVDLQWSSEPLVDPRVAQHDHAALEEADEELNAGPRSRAVRGGRIPGRPAGAVAPSAQEGAREEREVEERQGRRPDLCAELEPLDGIVAGDAPRAWLRLRRASRLPSLD